MTEPERNPEKSPSRAGGPRTSRPLTRLTVVLPGGGDPAQAAMADLLAAHLGSHGVQVARHVRGLPPEGAFRADVALWLPDPDGGLSPPAPGEAPARVQVGLVGTEKPTAGGLSAFDAVVCVHECLVGPVKKVADRVAGRAPDVTSVRLPVRSTTSREAEKIARRVEDQPVVMIDVRRGFERDIDRVVFQVALKSRPAQVVLLVPHDERARARTRQLAERHEVEAWLASGPEALPSSVGAVDLLIGRPRWVDLALAASAGTDVLWLEAEDEPAGTLVTHLQQGRALGTVEGVLQLAASLDRKLADPGAFRSEGTLLAEQLIGDARTFLNTLGELREHVPTPRGAAAWERIGPDPGPEGEPAHVEAQGEEGSAQAASERADRIEEELEALRARMEAERSP